MGRAQKWFLAAAALFAVVYVVRSAVDLRERRAALREDQAAFEALEALRDRTCPRASFETDRERHECRYQREVERLAAVGESRLRTHHLPEVALTALDAGRGGVARARVREARAALEASRDDRDASPGEAAEKIAVVEGRLALAAGDTALARRRLLESARALEAGTQLSFGPNVTLARDLLAAGDTAAVRSYFDALGGTWKYGARKVTAWCAALDRGEAPDFGPNLIY